MNEKVKELLVAVGALTELWVVTYNNFRNQGLKHSDALDHTGAFIKVLISQTTEK